MKKKLMISLLVVFVLGVFAPAIVNAMDNDVVIVKVDNDEKKADAKKVEAKKTDENATKAEAKKEGECTAAKKESCITAKAASCKSACCAEKKAEKK